MDSGSRSGRKTTTELHHMSRKWKDPRSAERSPEHTKVWFEPHPNGYKPPRKVPVVYYLSRNGNLEHPHFIEVPISCADGLYLRDVIDRLDSLRGKGMAALYSWSSKRSYKNGFVWHDLSENDFIYPANGQEYILKGSELVVAGSPSLTTKSNTPEFEKSGDDDFPVVVHRRRNQSWSSLDLHEYKVYSGDTTGRLVSASISGADALTQTDDKQNCSRRKEIIEEEIKEESIELTRDEISPPPSDSSPETLETLMKADGKLMIQRSEIKEERKKTNPTVGNKGKASSSSSVLMQLISCGSISFRDCGPGKENPGFSLISQYKTRMVPRGVGVRGGGVVEDGMVQNGVVLRKNRRNKKEVVTEDKEYFSGSLIETKKVEFPAVVIKRSNSYNGDR